MFVRSLVVPCCVLGLLVSSVRAQDDAAKQELQRLQGVWKCVAREGKAFSKPPLGTHYLTVSGSQYRVEVKDQPEGTVDLTGWGSNAGTFLLDPGQTPKRLDARGADRDAPPWMGIYRLEGKRLSILFRTFDRPKGFDDRERTTLITFERVNQK